MHRSKMKARLLAGMIGISATLSSHAFAQDAPADSQPEGQEAQTQTAPEDTETPQGVVKESDLSKEQREAYDTHLRAGKVAYASSDFETAFKELNAAHEIFPNAAILFNLALISEKGGALERAGELYTQYLAAPGVTLENRKRASDRLKAVQDILATTTEAERANTKQNVTDLLPALEAMGIDTVPRETTAKKTVVTPKKSAGPSNSGETKDEVVLTPSKPDVTYGWPVYAALGTATVALAGGVVMVAMTNKKIEDGRALGREGDNAGLEAAEDDASMYMSTAAGLFAGGAVFAIVGSYFAVRDSNEAAANAVAEPSASLSFSLHRDFLGPIFTTSF